MEIEDLFGGVKNIKQLKKEQIADSIYNNLQGISINEFCGIFTDKITNIIEYYELSNNQNTCQLLSLLFNPHRLDCISNNKTSIYKSLSDKSFISGWVRSMLLNSIDSSKHIGKQLFHGLTRGVNGRDYIQEFPPNQAVNILRNLNMDKKSKILDPCAGWGGRMIGVSIITDSYDCFEPSTQTYNGLLELAKFIQSMNPTFKPNINCLPFEESELKSNYYDCAITSPPYYDTEKYSDEPTNSLNKFSSFEEWVDGFYLPLISKTMESLKDNCFFVLNIGSRKYPLNEILLSRFSDKYEITKSGGLSGNSGGLGKTGEGEVFYYICKTKRNIN